MGNDALERVVTLPKNWLNLCEGIPGARWAEFPVKADWPELRLTEEQILANGIARAYDQEEPYPDHSIFSVRVPLDSLLIKSLERK